MVIVGLGGTLREGSSSEAALRAALGGAASAGVETVCFAAADLDLPMYDPRDRADRPPAARRLVDAIRDCSGLVISSPGYHGTVSGLVKNALDYVEDLAEDI